MSKLESSAGTRIYDVVVFGASGFTGKYIMEELWLHHPRLTWAAAGRNREKVQDAIEEVRSYVHEERVKEQIFTPNGSLEVPVIEAEVADVSSLIKMCQKTKIIINCVGPFNFYGEKVVAAAIHCGTHHVDVSGEPLFLESMQLKYFKAAQEKHVYIVGSCGFDSVPSDLGVEYLKSHFQGELCFVDICLKFIRAPGISANFATWESAINGFLHLSELKPIRNRINNELFPQNPPRNDFKRKKPMLFKDESSGEWCIPFVGSDRSVCTRTQRCNFNLASESPVGISTHLCVGSLLNAIGALILASIFIVFTKFSYGRHLLKKFPEIFSYGLFSKSPPNRKNKNMPSSSIHIVFKGIGWPKTSKKDNGIHLEHPHRKLQCHFQANDDGYPTTAVCAVSCAEVILFESEKLPDVGGVFTPGTAFRKTTLIEKMKNRGLTYTLQDSLV